MCAPYFWPLSSQNLCRPPKLWKSDWHKTILEEGGGAGKDPYAKEFDFVLEEQNQVLLPANLRFIMYRSSSSDYHENKV